MFVAGAEITTAEESMGARLTDTAQRYGIELATERLAQLASAAASAQRLESYYQSKPEGHQITIFSDLVNHVSVKRATPSTTYGGTAARLDFAPVLPGETGDVVSGATTAHREYTSLFSIMLIQGLQNYILLVESGAIVRPEILYGVETNAQMAIFAERLGILSDIARQHTGDTKAAHKKLRKSDDIEIYGNYEDIRESVFSKNTRRLEIFLARRLATKKLGTFASNL